MVQPEEPAPEQTVAETTATEFGPERSTQTTATPAVERESFGAAAAGSSGARSGAAGGEFGP
jgi:hypothetical protein